MAIGAIHLPKGVQYAWDSASEASSPVWQWFYTCVAPFVEENSKSIGSDIFAYSNLYSQNNCLENLARYYMSII